MPETITIKKQLAGHYMKRRQDRKYRIYEHVVWTKEEADQLGFKYCPVNDLLKPGFEGYEYIISDDDVVGRIYSLKTFKSYTRNKEKQRVRGVLFSSAGHVMLPCSQFLNDVCRGNSDYSENYVPWYRKKLRGAKGALFLETYLGMMLASKYDYALLGKMLYPNDQAHYWPFKAKYYLKHPEAREYLMSRLEKLMVQQGITETYVLGLFKSAVKIATDNDQADTIRKVAVDLAKMLKMGDEKDPGYGGQIPSDGYVMDEADQKLIEEAEQLYKEVQKGESNVGADNSGTVEPAAGGIEPDLSGLP